jgi:hypothetical protein
MIVVVLVGNNGLNYLSDRNREFGCDNADNETKRCSLNDCPYFEKAEEYDKSKVECPYRINRNKPTKKGQKK